MSTAYSALASTADHLLGNDLLGFHPHGQPSSSCMNHSSPLLFQTGSSKRPMDDEFCLRFEKRLKLTHDRETALTYHQGGPGATLGDVTFSTAAVVPQLEAYSDVNGFLRGLHSEQLSRRPCLHPVAQLELQDMEPELLAGDSGTTAVHGGSLPSSQAMTHFSLVDVVQCGHGPGGRCLQCSGRLVENVPLAVYSAFSRAYSAVTASSSSSLFTRPFGEVDTHHSAVELSFAAFVALAAGLSPKPGERLLHLGSGAGRAVLTWALLLPQSAACGVESSPALHRIAEAAHSQLEPSIQQRIFLHHGDMFSVQNDWCQ